MPRALKLHPPSARVHVSGSKSITNRPLIAAALQTSGRAAGCGGARRRCSAWPRGRSCTSVEAARRPPEVKRLRANQRGNVLLSWSCEGADLRELTVQLCRLPLDDETDGVVRDMKQSVSLRVTAPLRRAAAAGRRVRHTLS